MTSWVIRFDNQVFIIASYYLFVLFRLIDQQTWLGNIKKERECPGIKNMIIEIRNSMNELNGTLDSDDERTDELQE